MRLSVFCDKQEYCDEFMTCASLIPNLSGDIEIECKVGLPTPDTVSDGGFTIFLIDYRKIGGGPWLDAIRALGLRGSASLFLVNEKESLNPDDRVGVIQELSEALSTVVPGSRIGIVSTSMASMALSLMNDEIGKSELDESFAVKRYLVGEGLDGIPDPQQMYDFSEFDQIMTRLQSFENRLNKMVECGFALDDISAQMPEICAVVSTKPVGKTMICNILKTTLPNWEFVERTIDAQSIADDGLLENADAVIMVSNIDFESDLHAFAHVLKRSRTWFVLNKSDDYVRRGLTGPYVLDKCLELAQSLGISGDQVLLESAYYDWVALQYRSGRIQLRDVVFDPEILLLDEWQLPLDKVRNAERLEKWLDNYQGLASIRRELGVGNDA